jgi:hypothetical protein
MGSKVDDDGSCVPLSNMMVYLANAKLMSRIWCKNLTSVNVSCSPSLC